MNLEYAILEGLKAKALAGIDLMSEHRFRRYIQVPLYQKNDLENPIHYLNSTRDVDDLNTKYYTLNMQFLLDFNRTFASAHNVNALLGASNESYTWERNMVRWRYTDPDLGLNSGTGATQAGQSANNYTSNQNTSKEVSLLCLDVRDTVITTSIISISRSATMDHRNFTKTTAGVFFHHFRLHTVFRKKISCVHTKIIMVI